MLYALLVGIVVLLTSPRVYGQTCSDIDTAACVSMQASQSDLCNTTLGSHACPQYCNLCGKDTFVHVKL